MPNLDGTDVIKPTPFDAHDKVLRESPVVHTYPDGPEGDPVPVHEYPKAVAHDENGEPVIAKDAAHEAELEAAKEN